MFYIDLVSCRNNDYTLVKETNKVEPIARISSIKDKNGSMNKNFNSSNFQEVLDKEVKIKKKTKID